MLQRGLSQNPEASLTYRRCYSALADDIQVIQRMVVEEELDYLIIDSLSGATGDDLKEQAVAAKFFTALASLRKGSLIITHVSKEGQKTPFGSAYWKNYARSVFELKQYQETGEDKVSLGLFHRKINTGRLERPIGLQITFAKDLILFEQKNIRKMPEMAEHLGAKDKIANALTGGPQNTINIASATNLTESTVRGTLSRGQGERFVKLPDGRWANAASVTSEEDL